MDIKTLWKLHNLLALLENDLRNDCDAYGSSAAALIAEQIEHARAVSDGIVHRILVESIDYNIDVLGN